MKNIGIDIGMKTCVVCVMDEEKNVLEEAAYHNTLKDATAFARRAAGRHGRCRAVCESTGNMWLKSFEGFERADIPIVLANLARLKAISQTSAKTDKIDARALARLLFADMIPACHVPERDVRSQKQLLRHRIALVQDRTRMSNRAGRLLDKYDVAMRGTRLAGQRTSRCWRPQGWQTLTTTTCCTASYGRSGRPARRLQTSTRGSGRRPSRTGTSR